MKVTKGFRFCETCNKQHANCSPPAKVDYRNGLIIIRDGSVLLAEAIESSPHAKAKDIDGIYCNLDCLVKRLQKIRKWDKPPKKF